MARRQRKARRSQPKIYLFLVEGCTEENYIHILNKLYKEHRQDKAKTYNCKGGKAKGVLLKAKRLIDKYKDEYLGYIVWFDSDEYFPSSDSNLKNSLEARKNVEIYISEPCIENWLLAHFQTISIYQDKCESCIKDLKIYISNYEKNDCPLLENCINQKNIETAIKNYPIIGQIPEKYFKNQA